MVEQNDVGNPKDERSRKKRRHNNGGTATTAELETIVFGKPREPETTEAEPVGEERLLLPEDPEPVAEVQAAWHDPDDTELVVGRKAGERGRVRVLESAVEGSSTGQEYVQQLRQKFEKAHHVVPRWVQKTETGDLDLSDSEPEQLVPTSASSLAKRAGGPLPPTHLEIERLRRFKCAEAVQKGAAAISSLQFHPTSELLLAAGRDQKLRLYAVEDKEAPKTSSYFFKDFPILEASFSPSGDEVLMTGTGCKMWGLDVATGDPFNIKHLLPQEHKRLFGLAVGSKEGHRSCQLYSVLGDTGTTFLCDTRTKQVVRTFRMSSTGVASVFSLDRDSLFSADADSYLYDWDLGTGRCRQRIKEESAVGVTCMATCKASATSASMLAVGTQMGYVDVYDASGPLVKQPLFSVKNLTMKVTSLCFHPSGEALVATSSMMKEGGLKVVHTSTRTVFQNWPTSNTPLNKLSALGVSSRGGLMTYSDRRGDIFLYRLKHYEIG